MGGTACWGAAQRWAASLHAVFWVQWVLMAWLDGQYAFTQVHNTFYSETCICLVWFALPARHCANASFGTA